MDKDIKIKIAKCIDKVRIKMPKLEYPAFFDGDLLGVRAKE